jgi:3-hydroxy-9,10-secoandrosta-1,3,5(10)-triene-9,17-dione monooxygenase reductase component
MTHASATQAVAAPQDALDERALRAAFGRFATGVAFVTAEVDGAPHGLIVSSFAAVSLRPALVSFCPATESLTWRRMRRAGRFAVHVLDEDRGSFARRAAEPGADRFAEPDVLRHALAVIECDVDAEHAAGDHWIVVGRVRRLRVARGDRAPLVYFAGRFGRFDPH